MPDIKTVRTKFFVNTLLVAVVALLAITLGFREVKIAMVKGEINELNSRIVEVEKKSLKAIADNKLFKAEEKLYTEAVSIVKSDFSAAEFLLFLGSTLPNGVKIRRFDYRGWDKDISISGSVRGLDSTASNIASEYLKELRANLSVTKYFSAVSMPTLGRNTVEGNMEFELVFTFVQVKKGTK